MKALQIAPQPFFTPRGTPFSVYYRCQVLAQHGVEIDLLTYGEGADVNIPGVRIIRIPRLRWLEPVKIGPSLAKAILDVFMVIWTIGLLLRNKYDFVHAHEEAGFWCLLLKPVLRFKLVYDMHSVLSEQLLNFRFSKSRFWPRVFEKLEGALLRRSDAVITICPEVARYALKSGLDPERHLLIANSIFDEVQLRTVPDASDEPPAVEVPLPRGPRIVYAGTLETYQGIDLLIEAVSEVTRHAPEVELLIVGGAPEQVEAYKALAGRHGLQETCVFTGRVPRAQAVAFSNTADVLVSPRLECRNTPLKLYEQLASGKPLVATDTTGHRQAVTESACFLVDPTPAALAEGLLRVVGDPDQAAATAEQARALYEAEYSRSSYEEKVRKLLEVLAA